MRRRVPAPLRASAGALWLLALGLPLAGCVGPKKPSAAKQARQAAEREARKQEEAPLVMRGDNNQFTVEDERGRPVLQAKVKKVNANVSVETGIQGPATFFDADCRLYQDGKPHMDLKTPEATWDGKLLVAKQDAHAVMVDGSTIIDSKSAVWTARTGFMEMETAKVQALKQGKVDFTCEGPKAKLEKQWVYWPAGAVARNPEGRQLKADRLQWNLKSTKLEADGRVQVLDAGTKVSGAKLRGNTRLKQGRFTGGTRVEMASKSRKSKVQGPKSRVRSPKSRRGPV